MSSRRDKFRETVGVSADVAGLLALLAVAVPTVIGWIAGSVLTALGVALAVSIVGNIGLALRLRSVASDRSALRSRWESAAKNRTLDAARKELKPFQQVEPGASSTAGRWLADPTDLGSMTLTDGDLTKCLEAAQEIARVRIGASDVRFANAVLVYTDSNLALPSAPWIGLVGTNESDMRSVEVTFRGSLTDPNVNESAIDPVRVRFRRSNLVGSPWTADPSWTKLIRLAWQVTGTFQGAVTLSAAPVQLTAPLGLWRITFSELDRNQTEELPRKETEFGLSKQGSPGSTTRLIRSAPADGWVSSNLHRVS